MNALIIFGAKYLIYILLVFAAIYFFLQPREKQKEIAIFGIIVLPVTYIAAKLSGLFYYDPRPFVIGHFTPLIPHIADNGFPSDHALLGSAVATVAFYFNKKWGVFLFLLTVLIGAARVLAEIHHAVDILGSMVIAIAVAIIFAKFVFEQKYFKQIVGKFITKPARK